MRVGEAPPELKDAMDLAYLTGQRPADVLKASTADLNNGFLMVGQASEQEGRQAVGGHR